MRKITNDSSINSHNKFKFLNDQTFARHPRLPNEPCYRLIICHALFSHYLQQMWQDKQLEGELDNLNNSYNKNVAGHKDWNELQKELESVFYPAQGLKKVA